MGCCSGKKEGAALNSEGNIVYNNEKKLAFANVSAKELS